MIIKKLILIIILLAMSTTQANASWEGSLHPTAEQQAQLIEQKERHTIDWLHSNILRLKKFIVLNGKFQKSGQGLLNDRAEMKWIHNTLDERKKNKYKGGDTVFISNAYSFSGQTLSWNGLKTIENLTIDIMMHCYTNFIHHCTVELPYDLHFITTGYHNSKNTATQTHITVPLFFVSQTEHPITQKMFNQVHKKIVENEQSK